MHFELQGYISIATLLAVLWMAGELRLYRYQFKLMWRDYCKRHGIPYNGTDQAREHATRQGD